MRPTEFSTDTIVALLRNQTIASLPEVIAALGPGASRRTAFRRLKDLAARNSYWSTSTRTASGRSPASTSPASAP